MFILNHHVLCKVAKWESSVFHFDVRCIRKSRDRHGRGLAFDVYVYNTTPYFMSQLTVSYTSDEPVWAVSCLDMSDGVIEQQFDDITRMIYNMIFS